MGPLRGIRVLELAAIGPLPLCGMILADLGADVVRVDRIAPGPPILGERADAVTGRNRRSVAIDLKQPEGVEALVALATKADVFLEGFRPGVTERLGIGPDVLCSANPKLVYGRMTGWGQDGPLASTAGHDIDYIAIAGALGAIGREGSPPVPPLNLVGDYGGGGMLLALGVTCALLERAGSGQGQVVDAAMVDGALLLLTPFFAMRDGGDWPGRRGENLLDSGAPFYDVYATADERWLAVGAIEPQFFAALLDGLGLEAADLPRQHDRSRWPELRARLAAVIVTEPLDHWVRRFEGTDACVSPVLELDEVADHPHLAARGAFVEVDGIRQPAPAPRFSRTPGEVRGVAPAHGQGADSVFADWGLPAQELGRLREIGALS